jgi:transporter family protein
MWIALTLLSALMLGIYDIFKKHAVHGNAVLPVLFFATLSGTIGFHLWLCLAGHWMAAASVSWWHFGLLWLKSLLVGFSWILAYFALRDLPITIAAPIRGSAPLWTLLGALLVFGEQPSWPQWIGMGLVFAAHQLLSRLGRKEGIDFGSHRGIWAMMVATALGAGSALYDKHLLQRTTLTPDQVQFWFSLDLVILLGAVALLGHRHRWDRTRFDWRWSIPITGILLIIADQLYFRAVNTPDTMISVLSMLRRCSVIVTFAAGAWIFRDKNVRQKAWVMVVLLAGILLLCWK